MCIRRRIRFRRYHNLSMIVYLGMPRKRKILVLVNPFSGRQLAARNWEIAKPVLEQAYIEMKVIMTERAGHAYDIVN